MNGDKRNFSLSIWDHKDNFICNLKSANTDFEGQSFNENFTENINGEKTLTFSIPMYIFSYDKDENGKDKFVFEQNTPWNQNEVWKQIKNEQKIRYTEYHPITNEPIRIEEFVLKEFTESRNGEEKIADCVCESLAVYELGKVGWGITFDTNYITDYELSSHEENIEGTTTLISNCSDLLTIDYWMKKLLYKETNLGRVSNTTECTYLLQGLQLRDDDGYPISNEIKYSEHTNYNGTEYIYNRINEPIATSSDVNKYKNETGWTWEVIASFENDPNKQSISTLYEAPVINQFIEIYPNYYLAQSYQKRINTADNTKQLRRHPIPEADLDEWTYVTDIKKRLITEERSNIFSIIQNLCETFEVWADFQYEYDKNSGKIISRKILFKTESIDENIKFDFSYGKNLQSVSRIKNSNDLITKLYVTNTESNLVDGNILSIQESFANPTGENYLYNFDYFYNSRVLTKEDQFDKNHIQESDEYKINLYYGKLRNINNQISNIQKFLIPLYDRQTTLEGDLVIQEGSINGYMDNIQAIQSKIDAIPPNDRTIKSWSDDNNQYNHVGELKNYSVTTTPEGGTGTWYYLDFGREDILIKDFKYEYYEIVKNNNNYSLSTKIDSITTNGFIPRYFAYGNWQAGGEKITDNNTDKFISFSTDRCIYNYSLLNNENFIKGIYFPNTVVKNATYGRIRYKYAPLAYYYLLIKDYWDKINKEEENIEKTQKDLLDIKNKILSYDLKLKNLLKDKNELILQFENNYKPLIREGYWEPSDYQSQLKEEIFDTSNSTNFRYFKNELVNLNTLKLNDSLSTYSYCFSLGNAEDIDLTSIKMRVLSPLDSNTDIYIPHYQSNNYELYLSNNNLYCAIDPDIITNYNMKGYTKSNNPNYYKTEVTYRPIVNGIINTGTTTKTFVWDTIDNVNVNIPKIYLDDDNILTDKLKIYGDIITDDDSTLLIPYEDYSYTYESTGYNTNGKWVDLSNQNSYSTDIQYIYSFRIDLKLTNNTIKYLSKPNQKFIISYGKETTLQYIYNDAVVTSKKYATPQVEYNMSVIDLSSLNGYENYKPKLGQKVPIFDPEMNFYNFEGFITSINYPLEEKYNTQLTLATYTTKFEDLFQKLTATVSYVDYNSNDIYRAADSFETNGAIKTDVFRKSLEENFEAVNLGVNNEITIDKTEGITLKDNDNNSGVKLIGRGIFLTKDITKGENTEWRTGITGEGINTNMLTAGSLDTKQITIWNSSEKQARFIWNEQGLFAYGDKFGTSSGTSTYQELIDYNKFVKYNHEGLEFNDNGKSALKLGWQGLSIQAQNEALELNADKGLILKNGTTTRLELGKLDNGTLYGLRLSDTTGTATFQSDSGGNLWLHQHIRLGGTINSNNIVQNPTAGIYGLSTNVPEEMQMGIRRNDDGKVIWDTTPIRFWAGPQEKNSYTTKLHITSDELNNSTIDGNNNEKQGKNKFNSLPVGSPSLAKFKVSAKGDIIASGIDVGGWIGAGSKLHSFDNEAILRSGGYSTTAPVLAIGKPESNANTDLGSNYNFKIYQDGSLDIGNGKFTATSNGAVIAKNITIQGGNTSISSGNIASLNINNGGLEATTTYNGVLYKTGVYGVAAVNTLAFRSGPDAEPNFSVDGFGNLTAKGAYISGGIVSTTGTIGGWTIRENILYNGSGNNQVSLYSKSDNNSNTAVILIGNASAAAEAANANTKFKVSSDGSVYFHGGIYGWSTKKNGFKKGLSDGALNQLLTSAGKSVSVEICQGLIIDIS